MYLESLAVTRSLLRIRCDTLTELILGRVLTDQFKLECRIKPAFDNNLVMLEVCPAFLILDAGTKEEVQRFQTEIAFSFVGTHSKAYIRGLIYHLTCLAIDEFNAEFHQSKSLFSRDRTFEKPSLEEIEPYVTDALKNEMPEKYGVIPYWKLATNKTIFENEHLISTLPPIPSYKMFIDSVTTQERLAISRCIESNAPDLGDLKLIKEAIQFYRACFHHLKKIDLRTINDFQCARLKAYLGFVLNVMPVMTNDIKLHFLFRVTVIKDEFMEEGKLRSKNFLSYPPLKLIKERGIYNRASSPDSTLFYASMEPNVALREIRPAKGQRIVISKWFNHTGITLNTFPLCLTAGINNDYADKNNYAFEEMIKKNHPLMSEWFECCFSFFSSEFIKECEAVHPKRYDYLFSAFFADRVLQPFFGKNPLPTINCIVYPSVAWNHLPDNIAIIPEVIDKNFSLLEATEYEVEDTWYKRKIALHEFPAKLKMTRNSVQIVNNKIIWNDDV